MRKVYWEGTRTPRVEKENRSLMMGRMDLAAPLEMPELEIKEQSATKLDPGYMVICWNDPVNLMEYVTHVFQVVFGWPRKRAEHHMMEVHTSGKSVLVRESFEKAEHFVHQLQGYSLDATMEREQ
jgi:ATP-dependent Clp protease adaptor protein ClpS